MKRPATEIRKLVGELLVISKNKWDDIAQGSTSEQIDASKAISNLMLNLERLEDFYSDDDRAAYFPFTIENEIRACLQQIQRHISEFNGEPTVSSSESIVMHADQLYAISLRGGLISFGLNSNQSKKAVHDVESYRHELKKILEEVKETSNRVLGDLRTQTETSISKSKLETDALILKLGEESKACDSINEKLNLEAKESEKRLADIGSTQGQLTEIAEQITNSNASTQKAAKEASERLAEITAQLSASQEMRAKLKTELEEVTKFFNEIEVHKGAMADAQKKAEAKFNALNEKHDNLIGQNEKKTLAIIEKNEQQQEKIDKHLQRAAGVSLFKAFDTRRSGLYWGKWIWLIVLALSVIAAGVLSWWLANSLNATGKDGLELAFFIKLSAAIPVTFALIFSSRQYSNERRAEEEYAFKSTISVSLEPYKQLLQQMKEEGHTEQAAFVEKLLAEIFDNPVKRIFSDREGPSKRSLSSRELRTVIAASKDFDVDKVKEILALMQRQ